MLKKLSLSLIALTLSFSVVHAQEAAEQAPEQATQQNWLEVPQDNILYMEFETGTVRFHLAEFFAPNHVQHIRELVTAGLYDGIPLYRVIENFVVQGGPGIKGETSSETALLTKTMMAEMERPIDKEADFYLLEEDDLMAEQTGYINGFAVGRSLSENKEWLIHCNGAINLARGNDPDSGNTQFAIMFGGYQRYLDRNMSIFGRIIDGWPAYYKAKRGPLETSGVYSDRTKATKVVSAYLGSSLPRQLQQRVYVENPMTKAFDARVQFKRSNANPFFVYKGDGSHNVCLRPPTYQVEE